MPFNETATALKILFNEGSGVPTITRNEVIALVNTFNKFSTSLVYIEKMFERRTQWANEVSFTICIAGAVLAGFYYFSIWMYEASQMKLKRRLREVMRKFKKLES